MTKADELIGTLPLILNDRSTKFVEETVRVEVKSGRYVERARAERKRSA